MDHVTLVTPPSGTVGRPKANNWYSLQAHTIWRSENISWGVEFQYWSSDPDHAHLRDSWSPETWRLVRLVA